VGDGDEGEDKIEKTAKKEGKTATEIAKFYEKAFYTDLKDLNVETKNTKFPRASEHINEQIEIIKILEEKGFTYPTSDGIYFDTSKFANYGKLGNINTEGQEEGARIGVNNEKKNKTDFALWKFSKGGKRLQEWNSPWGTGFPGWHIECSAMSRKYLGQPFDIHTGGIDHIPVHHNNEIAQSEAAFDTPLCHYWMHNEFLKVEGEKMSKSLGNVFTLSDLKDKKIHPLSLRYLLLSAKYNSHTNFTWESALGAQKAFEKIVNIYQTLPASSKTDTDILQKFEASISDDLNTPECIALLQTATSKGVIKKMDKILGLNIEKLSKEIESNIPEEITDLKKERDEARNKKEWERGDELRDEIEKAGYILEDRAGKTTLKKTLPLLV
jgi:cysteinyl-tRNA synthetase